MELAIDLRDGTVAVPVPPEGIGEWPVIGQPLERFWRLALVQSIVIVLIPTVVYVFATADPVVATVFLIWSLFVGLIDNVNRAGFAGGWLR